MKKRTKFYALLLAMVLSLTQMIGAVVPVKAATKECSQDVYKRQVTTL